MSWNLEDSKLVYGVNRDDLHFLDINEDGELKLNISNTSIKISDLLNRVSDQFPQSKYSPSFTLRMPQLIKSQIDKLISSFDDNIKKHRYNGEFEPLYPIKVNQHKREVTTVMEASERYGLEAGTKTELFLILKLFRKQAKDRKRIIMCNGVKDIDYIHIVKKAMLDNFKIYVSIESLDELRYAIEYLPRQNLNLFFRVKPYVTMHGYWGKSAGRNSKFGLGIDDIVQCVDILKENNMTNCLVGIHAHPGSQVSNFVELERYFQFMTKTYQELYYLQFKNLKYLNFGGGLPINYDGNLPPNRFENYSKILLQSIIDTLDKEIPHPNIMIEAGRAITALSSMLVIQPLEVHNIFPKYSEDEFDSIVLKFPEVQNIDSKDELIKIWIDMMGIPTDLSFDELREREKNIGMLKKYLRKLYIETYFDKADIETESIAELISPDTFLLGNFSVFNGVCDYVMIKQYFPVIPTIDLNVQPETLVRLVDITCDSDGEISIFRTKLKNKGDKTLSTKDGYKLISEEIIEWSGLPIGKLANLSNNYLVIPLVGAYQDIIEFDHNLIGDLTDVELFIENNKFEIKMTNKAQNVEELLKEVGYELNIEENPYISKGA